ncbi:hypothetical protein JR316_0005832 [Psilocybe cubensis]|uniref:Uncharacterized protein n=2 Tax=Psilocybe cubensis TaxID=181762 RepID=A0A8H8CKQ7_PSICU|nr:hypothetical protein JR316_0005832 [Psilocybe cubensis]KAH9481310.1 hypothetical protein JR316_0005832 [Psilocybe cubensis]
MTDSTGIPSTSTPPIIPPADDAEEGYSLKTEGSSITLLDVAAGDYDSNLDDHRPKSTSLRDINSENLPRKIEALRSHVGKRWSHVDAFSTISDILHQASQIFSTVEKLKAKYTQQNYTFSAISFSRVNTNHYEKLGISILSKAANVEAVITNLSGGVAFGEEHRADYFKTYGEATTKTIQNIVIYTGQKPEARGRLLIDQFILFMMGYFISINMIPLLFPELQLATVRKPVVVLYSKISPNGSATKVATCITGSVDYALFVAFRSAIKQSVLLKMRTFNNLSQLERDLDRSGLPIHGDQLHLFMVEAKKMGNADDLVNFIPQVVAEGAIIIAYRITVLRTKTAVTWCITTGEAWIFGISLKKTDHTQCLVYHSTVMKLNYDLEDQNLLSAQIKKFFNLMVSWSLSPALYMTADQEGAGMLVTTFHRFKIDWQFTKAHHRSWKWSIVFVKSSPNLRLTKPDIVIDDDIRCMAELHSQRTLIYSVPQGAPRMRTRTGTGTGTA